MNIKDFYGARITVTYNIISVAFIVLIIRYAYLQLFNHNQLLQLAVKNYTATITSLPIRGSFVDINGIALANNTISYAIAIIAKDLKHNAIILSSLTKYINLTDLHKANIYKQLKIAKNYDTIMLKNNLSNTEIANITSHSYQFPQLIIFAKLKRNYPYNGLYAHAIGYVGRINQIEKTNNSLIVNNKNNYLAHDYIGKSGLESYYESYIRGIIGKKNIKTDVRGNELQLINNNAALNGNTVVLTIDHKLQQKASDLMTNKKGAIVAINPQTGGILAFVSNPSFNPNLFIDGIDFNNWDNLNNNEEKPLINRASQSSYPPGSTFKPFLGIIALKDSYRDFHDLFFDKGYFTLPNSSHRFRDNDHPYGLGMIDMQKAIALSSDTYFYKLAIDMGIDNIDKGMTLFGFGVKTQLDISGEVSGLLPSRYWKAKRYAKNKYQKNWLPSDTVTVGIGQGFNHYTPLQMAYATAIIANDGVAIKPHFLHQIIDTNNNILINHKIESHILPIKKDIFANIKIAMSEVINHGTARRIGYGLTYTMAGKTGTAQVVSTVKNGRAQKFSGKNYRDHAWFIAFAPVEKPQIAIAVLVENGGFGGAVAAPIARAICDEYLLRK